MALIFDGASGTTASGVTTSSVSASTLWKSPVRVATVANGNLQEDFANLCSIDGVLIFTNDRILIKDQAQPSENGIYRVSATGAPTRVLDANNASRLRNSHVFVELGARNAQTTWVCTACPDTVGQGTIAFGQVGATGLFATNGKLAESAIDIDGTPADDALLRFNSSASRMEWSNEITLDCGEY